MVIEDFGLSSYFSINSHNECTLTSLLVGFENRPERIYHNCKKYANIEERRNT